MRPVRRPLRTLIYGAGEAGSRLAHAFVREPAWNRVPVGFVEDVRSLAALARQHRASHLVIADAGAEGPLVRELVAAGRMVGVAVQILPVQGGWPDAGISPAWIREVEVEDLLVRAPVRVDWESIALCLTGETVLVTGAGGSIGSELCRQVAPLGPGQLLLLGHGEHSIYAIDLELRSRFPALKITPLIADIQDEPRIRRIFETYRPGVVFHAAAHKHVPLMELNPAEAVKNNLFGTLHVARAADQFRAGRFVLISSDKAVNPTSVMGATKRMAEYVVQSLAGSSRTIFSAVRFGNVLSSRGSVVPLFKQQIAAGGPVTVTDERMTRYFMTIPEAVRLVIQAAAIGQGGEIFMLDMGEPIRIIDLARDLVWLANPAGEIEIRTTGIRPGEKLYEEMVTAGEGTTTTPYERIHRVHRGGVSVEVLRRFLAAMAEQVESHQANRERILAATAALIAAEGMVRPAAAARGRWDPAPATRG